MHARTCTQVGVWTVCVVMDLLPRPPNASVRTLLYMYIQASRITRVLLNVHFRR